MKRSLLIPILLILTGCASTRLPIDGIAYQSHFKVQSKAKILVQIKTRICPQITKNAKIQLVYPNGKTSFLKPECKNQELVALSPQVNPGDYKLRMSVYPLSLQKLRPTLTVEYANPDFNSEADRFSEAGVSWDANQPLKGTVSYVDGDRTDWIRLKGEKKRVFLTLSISEDTNTTVTVHRYIPDGTPSFLGVLKRDRPTAFYLGKEDLLVKVSSSNLDGVVSYNLSRRDEEAKKSLQLQVVDAYPTGGSSIVLIQPNAKIKAEDELRISGKVESGKWKELGNCRVTKASESGIQCELPGAWSEKFVEYLAVGTTPVSG